MPRHLHADEDRVCCQMMAAHLIYIYISVADGWGRGHNALWPYMPLLVKGKGDFGDLCTTRDVIRRLNNVNMVYNPVFLPLKMKIVVLFGVFLKKKSYLCTPNRQIMPCS